MQFKPRTTAPSTDNRFYYSDNIFYQSGYGMPNCTAYAWGRFYELLNELGIDGKPKLQTSNAENWYYEEYTYEKGQTPKLGAVIVWKCGRYHDPSDGAGHVAIVEQINDDGTIVCSNSNYQGTNFYLSTKSSANNYYLGSGYQFDGFIYLPKEFDPPKHEDGDIYEVNCTDGLWLLDDNGKTIKAYPINSRVEYLGVGYTRYGYEYWKVRVLADNNVGYMAKMYLTKVVNEEPTPSEPSDNDSKELQDKMKELEKENSALKHLLDERENYKEKYEIEKDGTYQIKLKKGETLIVK